MKVNSPALLGAPPSVIYAGDGEFRENRREWIQAPTLWTVIYYHHQNTVYLNQRALLAPPDSLCIFPPGCRAGHALIDGETTHIYCSFNLPATTGRRYAIPVQIEDARAYLPALQRACQGVSQDLDHPRAFVWGFLFSIAEGEYVLREHEALYAAEGYILGHLADPLRVPQIAEHAGVSPRQLLRIFRDEHRMTVQEFIRAKRVQEACRLLSTTDRTIKSIAAAVGVPDLAQFNKLIRAETGTSPRKFRSTPEHL